MNKLDINCDVGEGFGNEGEMMPFIQSCNIACGGHAGNALSMVEIVRLAIRHKVKIGAHPSYPDVENFGRKSIKISTIELSRTISGQIDSLERIIVNCGGRMNHIKPHGALYNDLVMSDELSITFLNIIKTYKKEVKLFVPYNSAVAKIAMRDGFTVVYEAFADRNYNTDLSLVSRNDKNAVITDPKIMLERILDIKNKRLIKTISGKHMAILASTFCVHSDTPNIIDSIKYLNKNLH